MMTVCVRDMVRCFGRVEDGEMMLNKYGVIVNNQWLWLGKHYPYVGLDEFVVMPNHVHGIIVIKPVGTDRKQKIDFNDINQMVVGTGRDLSLPIMKRTVDNNNRVSLRRKDKIKPLSELIGAFKTRSSKFIHKHGNMNFRWQRSFYDHIIRNEKELRKQRQYIRNNPHQWDYDRNNQNN